MALLNYFCSLVDLPASVQKETIVPVESSIATKKERGKYQHFTPEEKATTGTYASKHGVANAVKCVFQRECI